MPPGLAARGGKAEGERFRKKEHGQVVLRFEIAKLLDFYIELRYHILKRRWSHD